MNRTWPLIAAAVALAACGPSPDSAGDDVAAAPPAPPPSQAPAAQTPPPAAAPVLPAVDLEAVRARFPPNTDIQVVDLAAGAQETTVTGEVRGYDAPVYAIPLSAGQTLSVSFQPSNTNLYMNVLNVADQGAAAHRGDVDGENAVIRADAAGTYVIQPYQFRATARRGESGRYTITINRTP